MPKILVIADDFTGAAEIGGVAHLHGLSAVIKAELNDIGDLDYDVIVIDTHTRRLEPASASEKIMKLMKQANVSGFSLIFKKVDSVLRGPVSAELKTLLSLTGFRRALLLPANPSNDRVIKSGRYFIKGIPINQTDFINDPEYPRKSAEVRQMVPDAWVTESTLDFDRNSGRSIVIPDIQRPEDFVQILDRTSGKDYLPAGGADFFKALLRHALNLSPTGDYVYRPAKGRRHIIMGSRCDQSSHMISLFQQKGYFHIALPVEALTDNNRFMGWQQKVQQALSRKKNILLSRPERILTDAAKIQQITILIARTALMLWEDCGSEDEMIIEGGETASSLFRATGSIPLAVREVIASGIVKLAPLQSGPGIIVKPGSYSWSQELVNTINN